MPKEPQLRAYIKTKDSIKNLPSTITTMDNKIVKTLIGAVALSGAAVAGPVADIPTTPATTSGYNGGDFCSSLKNVGKLYKNKSNPFIQEVKIFGRAHYTFAHVDGQDAANNSISESYHELRRFRVGTKIKALNGLEFLFRANFAKDNSPKGGDLDWGYDTFDEAIVSYKFGDLAGIEDFKIAYGRHKVALSAEGQQSSKKIKTVERSAISNKVFTNRYTSLILSGKRGNLTAAIGLLSLDKSDFIGNWDAGNAVLLDSTFEIAGNDYHFDALYNFDEGSADDQVGMDFEYAASLATTRNIGGWDVLFNAIYGDNGDNNGSDTGGAFWGFVLQPSKYIIEDKLEAVFRYQYQGSSEDQGISALRRYFGQGIADSGSTSRKGDSHHSIYAGLNYFFCGHNSKVMIGAEYDTIETTTGAADGATLWAAYRMYF